jgi:hypothetical protein
VYIILPETKDVALEEVQHFFTKAKPTVFHINVEADAEWTKL